MSGVLIYSEKEAKRNTFAINKFKEELGVTLAINDYDGTADYIINRTNNYKIAEKFEKKGTFSRAARPKRTACWRISFSGSARHRAAIRRRNSPVRVSSSIRSHTARCTRVRSRRVRP